LINIDVRGPGRGSNSGAEAIYANVKGIGTRLYNDILNIYNKNQLEREIAYSTILKRLENKGLECDNPYGRY